MSEGGGGGGGEEREAHKHLDICRLILASAGAGGHILTPLS